jgi:predicted SprT family Zn-dependent metalloprotease
MSEDTTEEYPDTIYTPPPYKHYLVNIRWDKTEYYCYLCGKQPVYVEFGEGDYYVGPQYWCRSCDQKFTMG